jgi:4-amino-4-deoxy-L-arabinose transferase-like glycosyltransferase
MLVGLCLLVYLPGFFSLPPVDRDESRFAQASRQMFESVALPPDRLDPVLHAGGLVVPKVQGRDRLSKPPLIYWLQTVSAAALTRGDPTKDAIWMYRVPSLLAGIVAVLATWKLGASLFGPVVGFLGGVLLAVCPVLVWEAHQARADMVLLACSTVAMLALWRVYQASDYARSWLWPIAFWIALALGVITKGPITPMIAVLTVVPISLARRDFRWLHSLRAFVGLLILAAAVGPWVYAVAERVGWHTYFSTIFDETLGRSIGAKEGHWGPPGYHTILLPVLFWPGSMLTGLAVVHALRHAFADGHERRRPQRRITWFAALRAGDPAMLFCVAWLIPSWIVFELVTTKLPHYTMPLYPALAILSARILADVAAGRVVPAGRTINLGFRVWGGITVSLGAFVPLALAGAYAGVSPRHLAAVGVGAAAAVVLFALCLPMPQTSTEWLKMQARGVIAALFLAVVAIGILLPRTDVIWISPKLAAFIAAFGPNSPVGAVEYHEDSLVFLTRGRLERLSLADAPGWSRDHPDGLLVIPEDYPLASLEQLAHVTGLNYSRGRLETYRVVRSGP